MAFHLFWSKPRPFPPLPFALSLFPCIHLAWGLQRPRRVGFSVPGELKGEPEGARVRGPHQGRGGEERSVSQKA